MLLVAKDVKGIINKRGKRKCICKKGEQQIQKNRAMVFGGDNEHVRRSMWKGKVIINAKDYHRLEYPSLLVYFVGDHSLS